MKITAYKLTPGTVMVTGEVIIKAENSGSFRNKKMNVDLRKPNGTVRHAQWGYYSTIFCKSIPTDMELLA